MKSRRDKGASFCHESNVPNPVGVNFLATGGTQKCRGVNPILRSTPRKQVNIAAAVVIPPYKRSREPMLWTTKLVIADFLLVSVSMATGTKPSKFSSSPIQATGHVEAPNASIVP